MKLNEFSYMDPQITMGPEVSTAEDAVPHEQMALQLQPVEIERTGPQNGYVIMAALTSLRDTDF